MPKIACKCGYVMNVGSLDEEFAYDLISQNALWDITDLWSEKSEFRSEEFMDSFNNKSVEVYECPNCKRLLVEESPRSNKFKFYKIENK
ncbi:hypothetical protein [Vibrio parahaemolyticus]|uniref:hypothetical protein n=1 Tax=Gammaproteobacteria TaxID=1236 RepID=UPI001EEB5593|nr:hypothetical protein [Vibrio parahaemolyticus]MCG6489818.1 hypothetical protein [Vibrio parahaemolyticus]